MTDKKYIYEDSAVITYEDDVVISDFLKDTEESIEVMKKASDILLDSSKYKEWIKRHNNLTMDSSIRCEVTLKPYMETRNKLSIKLEVERMPHVVSDQEELL